MLIIPLALDVESVSQGKELKMLLISTITHLDFSHTPSQVRDDWLDNHDGIVLVAMTLGLKSEKEKPSG